MALFRSVRQTLDSARQLQSDARAMVDQANAPVDPSDPAFAPIHGVTLDRYAELSAALMRQSLQGPEAVDAWMSTQGVPAGRWAEVNAGWNTRMAGNAQLRNRYGVLFSRG